MSYDLSVQYDEDFSESARLGDVMDWLLAQPGVVVSGGDSFRLDVPEKKLWMELDVAVSEGAGPDAVFDCIEAHIPYGFLGEQPEKDYFPLLFGLAKQLGWKVFDAQEGEEIFPDG
jgi:hypothetical protein